MPAACKDHGGFCCPAVQTLAIMELEQLASAPLYTILILYLITALATTLPLCNVYVSYSIYLVVEV